MKTELRSKFFDGALSALIIMFIMFPLIMLFKPLKVWGDPAYWAAALVFLALGSWCLFRATQEKLSEVGRAWYGIFGGLCAWTVTEISHELGLIDIERADIVLVLAVSLAVLAVMWKYFPFGAHFWIVIFLMNWVGHVFIHVVQAVFDSALASTIFTVTTAGYVLLMLGLLYWIFARSQTRLQRLWAGVWIWHALSMMYFLLR
ncbi:MAG TPA: hypothetical protein DEH25_09030 [Chloroflexi bacterium]|nr:hypothetical protein [Chloroflexota bacterium]HBY07395.1 hypothetical protein [Chloroflexota bacterium]